MDEPKENYKITSFEQLGQTDPFPGENWKDEAFKPPEDV